MDDSEIYLPRLNIFWDDFRQSLKFARYILEKKLHDKTSKQSELVHLAFETAMIISYWRPFSLHRDFPGHAKLLLRSYVNEVLTEDQIKLHKYIGYRRDTDYAHSDANAHLDKRFDYRNQTFAVPHIEYLRLSKPQTEVLKEIIKKWIGYLEGERAVYVRERKARRKSTSENQF